MTKKKSILPMMAVTVIVTVVLAVGATLYAVDLIEKNTASVDDGHVIIEQTHYGAYAEYTLTADRDGTVKASDGGEFLVNGESVNTFNFVKNTTYTLTFYGGATPEVKL